jgi:ornithine carbamoyltransferase
MAAYASAVRVTSDLGAVAGAAAIYTDVWTSMGQEAESETRRAQFAEYQVNEELMELAPRAVFMHCLPAHRGEEVTAGVIDGSRSIVFDQAENRLWAQMALLALIYAGPAGGAE